VTDPEMLRGMIFVKGMREGYLEQPVTITHKPRKALVGRINFRSLHAPHGPTAGGSLDPTATNRDGVARRRAAAEMMAHGVLPFKRKMEKRPPTPEGIKLDGFMLLEAGDEELPELVQAVKLTHRHISSVEAADMAYFTALRVMDLADNRIPDVEPLGELLALRHLSLASNRMSSLGTFPADAFQELEVLDLSYNALKAEATLGREAPVAYLPKLRELNLSGNSFQALPIKLGPFESLEVLKLDDNSLSGSCLQSLSHLTRVVHLSLSHNQISYAPESLTADSCFPQLHTLDLTHNRVSEEAAISPLRSLRTLQRLLLAGNPLATAQQAARKKAKEKREMLAAAGALIGPEARMDAEAPDPGAVRVHYEAVPQLPPKSTIASTLTPGTIITISEPLDPRTAAKAAAMNTVAAVPEEAVTEAFERVEGTIEAWQLNTVDEGDEVEGEEEEEDGEPVEDMTFLTGVGIQEKLHKPRGPRAAQEEEGPAPPASEEGRPPWEEVEDPTERLALALGLDPRRLAIYTGQLTTDSLGSINALRFALSHPLVEADEGLAPPKKHLALTTAARLKRRDKKLAPLPEPVAMPPDARTVRIQTMEDMLQGMKERLKSLETNLAERLAAAPPPPTIPTTSKPGAAGLQHKLRNADELSGDDDEDDGFDPEEDGSSPMLEGGPRPSGALADEDAQSDMSALPDDVIDAIENPALSESGDEDNYMQEQDARVSAAGADPSRLSLGQQRQQQQQAPGRAPELAPEAATLLGYG